MVAIANLQYGWTLFVNPIDQKYGWGTPAIQLTFTIAITTETFLVVRSADAWLIASAQGWRALAGRWSRQPGISIPSRTASISSISPR